MTAIKISSKVEESVWKELKALARESHQNIITPISPSWRRRSSKF